MPTDTNGLAGHFRSLHADLLVLPNVWDVATARIVVAAGAAAVATTSAGVAWSLGAPDGNRLDRDRAIELVARIVDAVGRPGSDRGVPVTADIEGGYAADARGVAETIRAVVAAGAVGVNLEDADHTGDDHTGIGADPLLPVTEQCERIAAAREAAGPDLFVNARVDTYLRAVGDPATRLDATLERADAYLEAGADGIFVPGVTDPEVVAALAAGIPAPLNVLAGPGAPDVATLANAGAKRVSLGSSLAQSAYGLVLRAAREVLTTGTYTGFGEPLAYPELNAMFE